LYQQITPHLLQYVGRADDIPDETRSVQGGLLNAIPAPHYAVRVEELRIFNKECVLMILLKENNVHIYIDTLFGDFVKEHERLKNHILLGHDDNTPPPADYNEETERLSVEAMELQTKRAPGGTYDDNNDGYLIDNPLFEQRLYSYLTDSMTLLSTIRENGDMNQALQHLLRDKLWNYGFGYTEGREYNPFYNYSNPNTKCLLKLQARRLRKVVRDGEIDPYTPWVKDITPITPGTDTAITSIHNKFQTLKTIAINASNYGGYDGDGAITEAINAFETWAESIENNKNPLCLDALNALTVKVYYVVQESIWTLDALTEKKPSGELLNNLEHCFEHMRNIINNKNPEMVWLLYPVNMGGGFTSIDPLPE
jgi:hypothetical protein